MFALVGAAVHRAAVLGDYDGTVRSVAVDLSRPDVVIRTQSLSALPRDLLRVPLFKDLLSEEFVFYYEDDPDVLGLRGTLRRIAYEHELDWQDDFVAWALARPAEVALWRSPDGRLRHWLVAAERSPLARVVESTAALALSDRQLSQLGTLDVAGEKAALLALEYGPSRTLLLVAAGDRIVILSDPGLVVGDDRSLQRSAGAVVAGLLEGRGLGAPYGDAPPSAPASAHSLVVSARYLSFGYQRFFPGIEALRFEFGEAGWSTQALFDASKLPRSGLRQADLWTALPAGPAACALVPVDWKAATRLLKGPLAAHAGVLAKIDGPAAVCWYAQGLLQAPLFVASLTSLPPGLDALLDAGFTWAVRAGDDSLESRRVGQTIRWRRAVEVPFATAEPGGEPGPAPLAVTLARRNGIVLFSPDGKLVERALATLRHRYPSVADTLPEGGTTLAVLTPNRLAEMAERDALLMLPRDREPLFRNAAETLLVPRLATMARYPARRLVLPEGDPRPDGWQPVSWQELRQ